MQAIAAENNVAETAFVVHTGERFGIRWFTPTVEIDLCGHATLARTHVLLEHGYARGALPVEAHIAMAQMAVYATEQDIRALQPHMTTVAKLAGYGLIITAPGNDCDFVSRSFAWQSGVPEDPVIGSAQCTLIP
jgi:predicted PhzF superfamily epimerase YddE/YHI9